MTTRQGRIDEKILTQYQRSVYALVSAKLYQLRDRGILPTTHIIRRQKNWVLRFANAIRDSYTGVKSVDTNVRGIRVNLRTWAVTWDIVMGRPTGIHVESQGPLHVPLLILAIPSGYYRDEQVAWLFNFFMRYAQTTFGRGHGGLRYQNRDFSARNPAVSNYEQGRPASIRKKRRRTQVVTVLPPFIAPPQPREASPDLDRPQLVIDEDEDSDDGDNLPGPGFNFLNPLQDDEMSPARDTQVHVPETPEETEDEDDILPRPRPELGLPRTDAEICAYAMIIKKVDMSNIVIPAGHFAHEAWYLVNGDWLTGNREDHNIINKIKKTVNYYWWGHAQFIIAQMRTGDVRMKTGLTHFADAALAICQMIPKLKTDIGVPKLRVTLDLMSLREQSPNAYFQYHLNNTPYTPEGQRQTFGVTVWEWGTELYDAICEDADNYRDTLQGRYDDLENMVVAQIKVAIWYEGGVDMVPRQEMISRQVPQGARDAEPPVDFGWVMNLVTRGEILSKRVSILDATDEMVDPFGGCLDNVKNWPKFLNKRQSHFYSPNSVNNNCAFGVIWADRDRWDLGIMRPTLENSYRTGGLEACLSIMRQTCGPPINAGNTPISVSQWEILCETFSINVDLYCVRNITRFEGTPELDDFMTYAHSRVVKMTGYRFQGSTDYCIKVLLDQGHYYLVMKDTLLQSIRCSACFAWFFNNKSGRNHCFHCRKCVVCKRRFDSRKTHVCKGSTQKPGTIRKYSVAQERESWEDVYFCDLEAFRGKHGEYLVYSAALSSNKTTGLYSTPVVFWGENTLELLMDALSKVNGTCVFYYGSGFDNILLMEKIVDLRCKTSDMVLKDGRIINLLIEFKTGKKMRLWDLWQFTHCSLKRACKAYRVPEDMWKTDFDFELINNWKDVRQVPENVKRDAVHYVKMDVLALKHVFNAFVTTTRRELGIDPVSCMTLSQLAYRYWTTTFRVQMITLPNLEMDQYCRESYYGGKVMCCLKIWETKGAYLKAKIFATEAVGTEELKKRKVLYRNIVNYLTYMDVTSLYPYVMQAKKYPTKVVEIVEDETKCKEVMDLINGGGTKWVIAYVDATPPDDLLIPYLMRRTEEGGLEHSLDPIVNCAYAMPDLQEAIALGYKLTKVHSYVLLANPEYVFKSFIDIVFRMKKAATKGTPKYEIAKLIMNALSGKMGQAVIEYIDLLVQDAEELVQACGKDKLMDFSFLRDEMEHKPIACIAKMKKDKVKPSKPVFLASYILAYSRQYMSQIIRTFGGFRDENNTIVYTDTDSIALKKSTLHWLNHLGRTNVGEFNMRPVRLNGQPLFGRNLGQLHNELPESAKVIRAIFLAPKTYIMEYVDEDLVLKALVRCKGIPHPGEPYEVSKNIPLDEETVHELTFNTLLKSPVFKRIPENGRPSHRRYLGWEDFLNCHRESGVTICSFGMMKKHLFTKDGKIEIVGKTSGRTMGKTNWWTKGHRVMIDDHYSVPKGHILYNGE